MRYNGRDGAEEKEERTRCHEDLKRDSDRLVRATSIPAIVVKPI
jgi:hypothetical protein